MYIRSLEGINKKFLPNPSLLPFFAYLFEPVFLEITNTKRLFWLNQCIWFNKAFHATFGRNMEEYWLLITHTPGKITVLCKC